MRKSTSNSLTHAHHKSSSDEVTFRRGELGPVIPQTQYATLNWPGLDKGIERKTYADMVKLESVNIPSILHNVRERFKEDLFMTNIGDILVLVNPYKWIDSYYTMDVVAKFAGKSLDGGDDESNEDPHIFGIAAAAYRGITLAQRQNSKRSVGQAVIISGESGSGKTEATKKCLQYLTAVADGTVQAYVDQGDKSQAETRHKRLASNVTYDLTQKILSSNPILEALGNAKTVRNNNSSRFGKWMEIQFQRADPAHNASEHMDIYGCRIVNYLLEKTRLVEHGVGERNYHIFYQLCAQDAKRLHTVADVDLGLGKWTTFSCLVSSEGNVSSQEQLETSPYSGAISWTEHDKIEFEDVCSSIEDLGFSNYERNGLFRVVAAVLHLNNIKFECVEGENTTGSSFDNADETQSAVSHASRLLGCQPDVLEKNICNVARDVTARGETTRMWSPQDKEKAVQSRNALAKVGLVIAKEKDEVNVRGRRKRGRAGRGYSVKVTK